MIIGRLHYNQEITWYNEQACTELLGAFERLPTDAADRGVLDFLRRGGYGAVEQNRQAFEYLHQMFGRKRASKAEEQFPGAQTPPAVPIGDRDTLVSEYPLVLQSEADGDEFFRVYACFFREGILIVYVREGTGNGALMRLLERRDEVIRNLIRKRLPVFTDVAVLVADLQDSVRICSELPPDEYFELINVIWAAMEPIFRRYYGTHANRHGERSEGG
ncbi:MAG: hypothetical protein G8D59_13005 [gamma proteobacterium symbiont of Phacoides pectinatus]